MGAIGTDISTLYRGDNSIGTLIRCDTTCTLIRRSTTIESVRRARENGTDFGTRQGGYDVQVAVLDLSGEVRKGGMGRLPD